MEKCNESIRGRIVIDIKNRFEYKEEDSYKPVRVGNFWSNNYVKYERNSDKKDTIS